MATRLKKLRINRVDCVDAGANQHARIALYKRAESVEKDDEGGGPRTVNQILVEREAREEPGGTCTGALRVLRTGDYGACDARGAERLADPDAQ